MQAIVNTAYLNRIQLVLGSITGPLTSTVLGAFDPRRDLEVYVGGAPAVILSSSFDAANNRYLMYLASPIDMTALVQVVHHMPNPPFTGAGGVVVSGFALVASVVSGGDTLPVSIGMNAASTISTGDLLLVQWTALNVAFLRITLSGDYDSGLFSAAAAAGFVFIPITVSATSFTLTLAAYDIHGNPILVGGVALVKTQTIASSGLGGFGLLFGVGFGGPALP